MKASFAVKDVAVRFDGVQEAAIVTALLANISYEELVARDVKVAQMFPRALYDEVMVGVITLGGKLGLIDVATLEMTPPRLTA